MKEDLMASLGTYEKIIVIEIKSKKTYSGVGRFYPALRSFGQGNHL
jgi:hypothetical protein